MRQGPDSSAATTAASKMEGDTSAPARMEETAQNDQTERADKTAHEAAVSRSGDRRRVLLGLVGAAGLVAAVTLLARIAGLARYLVFGTSIGAGPVGTAYSSANLLPNILFEVAAGGALAATVIPLVATTLAHPNQRPAHDVETSAPKRTRGAWTATDQTMSALLTWMLALLIPLAAIMDMCAGPLSRLVLGTGTDTIDDASTVALGARLIAVFSVQLPLYGISVLLGAYLQARRKFFWPALVPLLSSLVVMATYRFYAATAAAGASPATLKPAAEFWLGWGTTAGVVVLAVPLIVPAWRSGLRVRPTLRFPQGFARRAVRLATAGLGAVVAQQGATMVVLMLAMRAGGVGTLPVYQYAQSVYLLPYAILIVPLLTSVFPHLSSLAARSDTVEFARTGGASVRIALGLGALGMAALVGAAPAVEQFFHRIDRDGAVGVGAALAALALGLIGYGCAMTCTRILAAVDRTNDALLVGSIGWVIGAVLILLLVLPSPGRQPAGAAVAFGLCLSIGMMVAGQVGIARVKDVLTVPGVNPRLGRAVFAACAAAVVGAVAGYAVSRPLISAATQLPASIAVGILAGLASLICATGVLLLIDRRLAMAVVRRGVDGPSRSLSRRRATRDRVASR